MLEERLVTLTAWPYWDEQMSLRKSLRDPVPEIEIAARRLNDAVNAHLRGGARRRGGTSSSSQRQGRMGLAGFGLG